ncbi:MAG: type II/IV secretion system protein [Planctomycetaceae bacterium]|nr:type II/IV secretion system protein [Planctomycetaceae bacterium]
MTTESLADLFKRQAPTIAASDPQYVPHLVTAILSGARAAQATDVHLVPLADALAMHWRIDGVLQPIAQFPAELSPRIVGRLKVLAQLLTYHTEVPQEGRLHDEPGDADDETRLSTFPTLFGEKAVIRLFVGSGRYRRLDELGLPEATLATLRRLLDQTGGVILVTGPAGSGKTTTIYAALRELADKSEGGRSLVSLEDPIEIAVPGVAQSQVQPSAGFDMTTGLRSLLRQDPEVIMVGEIRDKATAETVFQAALTGHLVLTTFHAGSAAQAVNRLSDMGIEPYLLRSAIQAILCQRLVRRLCGCARESAALDDRLGLPLEEVDRRGGTVPQAATSASQTATSGPVTVRLPVGCPDCRGTGYRGRFVLTELLLPERSELGRAILSQSDASQLERLAVEGGMVTQLTRGCEAVAGGLTSPAEIRRVLGFSNESSVAEIPGRG